MALIFKTMNFKACTYVYKMIIYPELLSYLDISKLVNPINVDRMEKISNAGFFFTKIRPKLSSNFSQNWEKIAKPGYTKFLEFWIKQKTVVKCGIFA